MAVPVRRRTAAAAPAADDYAQPTEHRARASRAARVSPREPARVAPVKKYNEDVLNGLGDAELYLMADEEGLPSDMENLDDIFVALLKIEATPAPEPESPARGRGRRAAPEPDPEPPARGRGRGGVDFSRLGEKTSEPERPRDRTRNDAAAETDDPSDVVRRTAHGGFDAFKKEKAKSSSFEKNWKPGKNASLVKFLDPEPFDVYGEHNLFRKINEKTWKGPRTFVCVDADSKCPLCGYGDPTRAIALFNVVVIDLDTGDAELVVLEAGPGLTSELEEARKSRMVGELDRGYFEMYTSDPDEKHSFLHYYVKPVSERDLGNFEVAPLSDTELDEFDVDKKGEDFVKYPSLAALRNAAEALKDADS